jgi:DNA adenine methylase
MKKGMRIHCNDLFDLLINFWTCVKEDPKRLAKILYNIHPTITKDVLQSYRKKIVLEEDLFKKAAMFFAINRCSFSGATFSGGFSEEAIEKRFTLSSIKRLQDFSIQPSCTFTSLDFEPFLFSIVPTPDSFIYADPPYFLQDKSNLYGIKGDLHDTFDHRRFFLAITSVKDISWMISYNDCSFIRDLYKDYSITETEWSYGMNKNKKSSEILINGGPVRDARSASSMLGFAELPRKPPCLGSPLASRVVESDREA